MRPLRPVSMKAKLYAALPGYGPASNPAVIPNLRIKKNGLPQEDRSSAQLKAKRRTSVPTAECEDCALMQYTENHWLGMKYPPTRPPNHYLHRDCQAGSG